MMFAISSLISLLTKKLLDLNYKIAIIDRLDWGVKPILQFVENPNLTIYKDDSFSL